MSGEFDVGHPETGEELMALMLATDSEIIHLIYYHKPGKESECFDMNKRPFRLPDRLRRRLAYGGDCPLYIVLWATVDFFGVCDQYPQGSQGYERILIGHLRRKP